MKVFFKKWKVKVCFGWEVMWPQQLSIKMWLFACWCPVLALLYAGSTSTLSKCRCHSFQKLNNYLLELSECSGVILDPTHCKEQTLIWWGLVPGKLTFKLRNPCWFGTMEISLAAVLLYNITQAYKKVKGRSINRPWSRGDNTAARSGSIRPSVRRRY